MDEKTKTIIDRARALLAAATPGPWEVCPDTRPDVRTTCNTGGFLGCGHIATVSRYDANEADAALIAAAPGLLATLCDAMESAERRAEEAEAQAAAALNCISSSAHKLWRMPPADRTLATDAVWRDMAHFEPSAPARALLDRLHAAEARVAEVEAAQKMRAESADPDDETWHTREEYLRRVKAEARVAELHAAEARTTEDEQLRLRLAGDLAVEQRQHEATRKLLGEARREVDGLRAERASVDAGVCQSCSSAWWAREHDQNAAKDQVAAAETALRAERVRASVAQVATNAAVRDLVSMAGECEHLREKLAAAEAKSARMVARVCAGCHGRGLAHLDGDSPRCAACGGSGAVIVEGGE